jgi:hypothetical protein
MYNTIGWIAPQFRMKSTTEESRIFGESMDILEIFEVQTSSFPLLNIGHPKTI